MHTFTVCEHLYPPDGRTDVTMTEYPRHYSLLPSPNPSQIQTAREGKGPETSTVLDGAWAQCRPKSQPLVSKLTQGSIRGRGENQVSREHTTSAKAPELTNTLSSVSNADPPHICSNTSRSVKWLLHSLNPDSCWPRNTMLPFLAPEAFLWLLLSLCS